MKMEGALSRKHEWQDGNKKSDNRSWVDVYMVLRSEDRMLSAYKDQRHAKEHPQDHYHHEPALSLNNAVASPATDYKNRSHVFRLKLEKGGEFLFQARNDNEMQEWIGVINSVATN